MRRSTLSQFWVNTGSRAPVKDAWGWFARTLFLEHELHEFHEWFGYLILTWRIDTLLSQPVGGWQLPWGSSFFWTRIARILRMIWVFDLNLEGWHTPQSAGGCENYIFLEHEFHEFHEWFWMQNESTIKIVRIKNWQNVSIWKDGKRGENGQKMPLRNLLIPWYHIIIIFYSHSYQNFIKYYIGKIK